MPVEQLQQQINELRELLERRIREHRHDGNESAQVNQDDLFGNSGSLNSEAKTVATTGNTDWYIIAPFSGLLFNAYFSGTDALAANDTNYITFSITNLGQDGSGSANLLSAGDENTTKATGGSAISADTKRQLVIGSSRGVEEGDRLRIRAAVTNTLANTITNSVFTLNLK